MRISLQKKLVSIFDRIRIEQVKSGTRENSRENSENWDVS